MPLTSRTSEHLIDLYAMVDSALPAQWIGFVALGCVAIVTAIAIAFLLFTDARRTRRTR